MTATVDIMINDFTLSRSKRWDISNPKRAWARYAKKDAKIRAEKKQVPFNLTTEYIETILPTHCPVFKTPFKYVGNGKIVPESPALDRIVPSLGYVEGNVHIISVKANNIKSAYTSKEVLKVAKWLDKLERSSK